KTCNPGDSETSFTGKLIASLTICHNTSSGTSGVANGLTTRKQTSVKGSERNSSSSSGERFAISAGMYNPPSGAIPRKTAPRKEVSGALFDVLRYLTPHHRVCLGPVPKTLSARATIRATLSLQSCSGRALHSFAAAQQLSSDSTELRSPVAF